MNRFPSISEASSIAIHSLALVADSEGPLNVNRLSEETGFSKNHIAKVMQTLVKHGYLQSGRGPKGGFEIRRKAAEVSLLEIIELIEGRKESHYCGISEEKCPFETCVFGNLPAEFDEKFREFYSNRMISEIKAIRKQVQS
ncbi:MAG TPA: Rrf2 family transcriptional regulator [Bacteroides sp.]|nr:Rrf2 family transcriptional regulator [Bacteroides sp.]